MKKSWAIDLHGVINVQPEFYASLTQSLVKDGWEIHILTGSHIVEKGIVEELKSYGIAYTHLFSIADHHKNIKTENMFYDKVGDPWISDESWDRTKAEYCKQHDISQCVDDTARYAQYFETPFVYMTIQKNNKEPNKYLALIIDMFNKRRESSAKIINVKNQMIQKALSNIPLKIKILKWKNWAYDLMVSFISPPDKLGKERN